MANFYTRAVPENVAAMIDYIIPSNGTCEWSIRHFKSGHVEVHLTYAPRWTAPPGELCRTTSNFSIPSLCKWGQRRKRKSPSRQRRDKQRLQAFLARKNGENANPVNLIETPPSDSVRSLTGSPNNIPVLDVPETVSHTLSEGGARVPEYGPLDECVPADVCSRSNDKCDTNISNVSLPEYVPVQTAPVACEP